MRDSVPSVRYSPVCNVLRQWKILLIPTYRVYRLYDMEVVYVLIVYVLVVYILGVRIRIMLATFLRDIINKE